MESPSGSARSRTISTRSGAKGKKAPALCQGSQAASERSKGLIERQKTSIVLVQPSLPANIGATARAMKNMGFSLLRLVNPADHLCLEARRMSSGSDEILENAQVFPTLEEALADLHVTVGCTARRGKERIKFVDPDGLARHLEPYRPDTRLGIVFGREARGLLNRELDLCNLLITIPTALEHPSLNLAQAVLVLCYELRKAGSRPPGSAKFKNPPATSEELEGLYQHAREVLLRIGFLDVRNPDRILRLLRRIFGRFGLDSREVRIFRGILHQIDWYAGITDRSRL